MTGAIVSFTAMAVAGRAASLELDTFEIMTYRSLIGLVLVVLIGGAAGTLRQVTRRGLHLHLARNLAHFAGQNLWFLSLTLIPLAQVFALEFTSPLWVMILAALFLGERFTAVKAGVAVVGIIGVIMVLQPGAAPPSPGMAAAALAAVGFAVTAIFTKFLTRTETITCILFWLTLMQLLLGLGFSLYDGQMTWPSPAAWPWAIVISIAGLAAHFCLTTALSLAPASVVMPMDFVRLPVIALVGVALYQEPLNALVLGGAALIFVANYVNIRAGHGHRFAAREL